MPTKSEQLKLRLDIQHYFIAFFKKNFSIVANLIAVSDHSLTFDFFFNSKYEILVVEYSDLFASKSVLNIKSTVDINFFEQIFNKLFDNEIINYKERLHYIKDELYQINSEFKFFKKIELNDSSIYRFKSFLNTYDGRTYHSLLGNNCYLKMAVNQNLYSVSVRNYHFLTGRFTLEFNSKKQSINYKCNLTTTSLIHSADYTIPLGAPLVKFENKFKICKRKMIKLILNECFDQIVINHNISLNRLKKMSEIEIKPYADLVHMSRI